MEVFDVAIIGLGVSGATLATLLDKKLKVIALDKKTYAQDSYKKPCGGLLSPDAQKSMARLNINLPKEILVDPQIFYVKTIDLVSGYTKNYQRFYLNIDRHKFDLWLMSMIPSNVLVEMGALCKSIKKENGLYVVEYSLDNKSKIIYAKNLVGSDGANSKVRKIVSLKQQKKYIAIQEWYNSKNENAFYSCIFDNTLTKNYAYSITKDNYYLLCGIFEIADARENFEKLKKKLNLDLANPIKREACLALKPSKMSDFCMGKDCVFLIGEAAGFISPSSFEGISYAIDSAVLLANTLNGDCKNKNKLYAKKTLKLRLKLMRKHFKASIIFNPFLRKIIMKSGVQSITPL